MEIHCEGRVVINLPEVSDFDRPQRVTTGRCPEHGPFRIVERYDVEAGQWEVVARFIVQEHASLHTRPAPASQPPTRSSPDSAPPHPAE